MAISARHFNPRTPRGVRPVVCPRRELVSLFQSTHPSRGATLVTLVTCTPFGVFQSTHPSRGATSSDSNLWISSSVFQSTHPLRGATSTVFSAWASPWVFQSTHPLRGATTIPERHTAYRRVISIHAPLAGCDFIDGIVFPIAPRRRRTHPVSGKKCAYPG